MNPEGNKKTVDLTKHKNSLGNSFSSAIFYLAILFFIIGFNFSDVMVGNWFQQFLPNLNGRTISDIFFIDSLNGWTVTPYRFQNDTAYVLKTTDGGNSWLFANIRAGQFVGHNKIKFINSNTGFVCGTSQTSGFKGLSKSNDGGFNWVSLNVPDPTMTYDDMSILNEDTIWLVASSNPTGGVFFTTNGGVNWIQQLNLGSQNPDRIYMINGSTGFISETNSYTRMTTNSGQNWYILFSGSGQGFYDLDFVNGLTGWGTFFNTRKSTDGGFNWVTQTMPDGGTIVAPQIENLSAINKDTIWGTGAQIFTALGIRGMVHRTTNGGDNWLFQVPDSTYNNNRYYLLDFYDKLNGWAYSPTKGVHTTSGGDPVWYTGIVQTSSNIPKEFELKQNYPNPFNPRTVIPYKLKKPAFVRLIAYEITGKETQIMVNQHQQAGEYEVDFMGKFSASGVYFYSLEVIDDKSKQLYTETKKMILLK